MSLLHLLPGGMFILLQRDGVHTQKNHKNSINELGFILFYVLHS